MFKLTSIKKSPISISTGKQKFPLPVSLSRDRVKFGGITLNRAYFNASVYLSHF